MPVKSISVELQPVALPRSLVPMRKRSFTVLPAQPVPRLAVVVTNSG